MFLSYIRTPEQPKVYIQLTIFFFWKRNWKKASVKCFFFFKSYNKNIAANFHQFVFVFFRLWKKWKFLLLMQKANSSTHLRSTRKRAHEKELQIKKKNKSFAFAYCDVWTKNWEATHKVPPSRTIFINIAIATQRIKSIKLRCYRHIWFRIFFAEREREIESIL